MYSSVSSNNATGWRATSCCVVEEINAVAAARRKGSYIPPSRRIQGESTERPVKVQGAIETGELARLGGQNVVVGGFGDRLIMILCDIEVDGIFSSQHCSRTGRFILPVLCIILIIIHVFGAGSEKKMIFGVFRHTNMFTLRGPLGQPANAPHRARGYIECKYSRPAPR